MSTLLIQNGTVVTSADQYDADVFIVDEKVHCIGKDLQLSADQTIDAHGCYLIPGGIDPHTHLDMPFMGTRSHDTFETGTLAGLHGGTTSVIDYAIQGKGNGLGHTLNEWQENAACAVGDYAFHLAITDVNEQTRAELPSIIHDRGVPSFKIFMAYKGALMIDDRQIMQLLASLKEHGGLLNVHAENGDWVDEYVKKHIAAGNTSPRYHCESRPVRCEAEASGRVIDLASASNADVYIVHMTCEEALNRVRAATLRNQRVFAETCVQYLLLDESLYYADDFSGAQVVMSPPLRHKSNQEALWSGINQNLVRVVATDHCPFTLEQKAAGRDNFSLIPNGAPAIEHRMALMYSEGVAKGRISLNKFVDVTSTAAARLFGLWPRKGTIAVGSDADIVLFDPQQEHTISAKTHHMNVDYSTYEGWKVQGECRTTILRGQVAVQEGKQMLDRGHGKFLPRKKYTGNI